MHRISHLRARLTALRDALLAGGDVKLETIARPGDDGRVDDDAAPLSEMNQVIASTRNSERTRRLGQIDAALERLALEPEDFGHCEDCQEPIAPARLELMPWAKLCLDCQDRREEDAPGGTRKNLRDFR